MFFIALDGFEEGRHKEVLSNLVQAYGIHLGPEPEYRRPRHPRWAFMTTGFSECIDSFFAFGLFAVAKQSRFFPPDLVEVFRNPSFRVLFLACLILFVGLGAATAWWLAFCQPSYGSRIT